MKLQTTVVSIVFVTAFISLLLILINRKLRKFDPLSEPKGIVLAAIMGVQTIDKMVKDNTNDKVAKFLTPYMLMTITYIFLSNISGLFSLESPTSNYSVTLTLAFLTCVLIEVFSIKENGLRSYIHGLFEPFFPFVVMNLISRVSTLLSLSMRLFGNIIAGSILMSIIYQLFGFISAQIPIVGQFNIVAVLIAPALHFYFDLFAGAMQAYVFTVLTISFIGKELPQKEN
ncbi:MAG: F0F1 ATP synthase subunit A [Erysipelotrichia bacterium]|nr:F0F1 ATP synthase subunit A [Erysipelotrichia bacterium]